VFLCYVALVAQYFVLESGNTDTHTASSAVALTSLHSPLDVALSQANKHTPVQPSIASVLSKSAEPLTRRFYWPNPFAPEFALPSSEVCENVYQYACGAFVENSQYQGSDSTFSVLRAREEEVLNRLLLEITNDAVTTPPAEEDESVNADRKGVLWQQQQVDDRRRDREAIARFHHTCTKSLTFGWTVGTGTSNADRTQSDSLFQSIWKRIDSVATARELLTLIGELQILEMDLPIVVSVESNPLRGRQPILLVQTSAAAGNSAFQKADRTLLRKTLELGERLLFGESSSNFENTSPPNSATRHDQCIDAILHLEHEILLSATVDDKEQQRRMVRAREEGLIDYVLDSGLFPEDEYFESLDKLQLRLNVSQEFDATSSVFSPPHDILSGAEALTVLLGGYCKDEREDSDENDDFKTGERDSGQSHGSCEDALHNSLYWVHSVQPLYTLLRLLQTHSLSAWRCYLHALLADSVLRVIPPPSPPSNHETQSSSDTEQLSIARVQVHHGSVNQRHELPWQRRQELSTALRERQRAGNMDVTQRRQPSEIRAQCSQLLVEQLPKILGRYYSETVVDDHLYSLVNTLTVELRDSYLRALLETKSADTRPKAFAYLREDEREMAIRKLETMHFMLGGRKRSCTTSSAAHKQAEEWPRLPVDAGLENHLLELWRMHASSSRTLWISHSLREKDEDEGLEVTSSSIVGVCERSVFGANAYYDHRSNVLTVQPGLLAMPLFSSRYDRVHWYARLGTVLAHEMAHAFDRQGVLFDELGGIQPWLTQQSAGIYQYHLACFARAYDCTTRSGSQHDGVHTLDENVADITGFDVAFDSYVAQLQKNAQQRKQQQKSHTDNTDDGTLQRYREFYLSYAQLYCESMSVIEERAAVRSRTHSLGEVRVQQVLQSHPWFRVAFQCDFNSVLDKYLQERCTIL